jgi:hypothetical protein
MLGMGWDVIPGGIGPILHVKDGNYGLGLADNNDGHSNGEVNPGVQLVVYFSGDDISLGAANTDYNHQSFRRQAAGDRYVTNGFTSLSPMAVMAGAGPAIINGPFLPGGMGNFPVNLLSINQDGYNEIPSIPPPLLNTYMPNPGETMMDDMDALELTPIDLNWDNVHDTSIYFSLDPLSPGSVGGPAAVHVSAPLIPWFGLFAAAGTLGLVPADDVDALAVWDGGAIGQCEPGIDFALFSLERGSRFLYGPDALPNTPDDFSAADIFVTDFSGVNALFLPAGAIGMLFHDNVDALDVEIWTDTTSIEAFDEIPEPTTMALLVLGGFAVLRRKRRR